MLDRFLVLSDAATLALITAAVLLFVILVLLVTRRRRGAEPPPAAAVDTGGGAGMTQRLLALERETARLAAEVSDLRRLGARTISHVGVVRYDAFQDMGGHMSFSLALLDGNQDGVVVSVLNGREGSRGYAKAVSAGRSTSPLSREEQDALTRAIQPS